VVEAGRRKRNRRMAVIAVIAASNMRRVLADGYRAVMAGRTGANDLGMVHCVNGRENNVVVAVFANIRRQNMCWAFADCIDTVVTAYAVARDVNVVEVGRYPAVGCMTVITGVATGDVRRVLACSDRSVVAGRAGANHLGMVYDNYRGKRDCCMTVLTNVACLDVHGAFPSGIDAVVAAHAVTADVCMIKQGRNPAVGLVTVIALFT